MTAQTPFDLFVFYLSPAHLKGKAPRTTTVKSVSIDNLFNPRTNATAPAIVLHFDNVRRSLKLNKTQASAMMEITGHDEITAWVGAKITISHAITKNHKETIQITKPQESTP
jgi:hypothetical protein